MSRFSHLACSRKGAHHHRRRAFQPSRSTRLSLEALEARCLLAVSPLDDGKDTTFASAPLAAPALSGEVQLAGNAEIHGLKWSDVDSDGTRDLGEPSVPNWSIYLDLNRNGQHDAQAALAKSSTDVPKNITDNTTVTSTLTVDGAPGALLDVNVTLSITHTYDADLNVFLISPIGTRVELFTAVGGSNDNFLSTTLDDEAATSIAAGTAPFTGSFRPEGLLSAVDSQDGNGVWTLEVTDTANLDVGTLVNWSLTLTVAEPITQTIADGSYAILGLPAGTYTVAEVAQAGWVQTYPDPSPPPPAPPAPLPAVTTEASDAPAYLTGDFGPLSEGDITPQLAQSSSLIRMNEFRADPRFASINGQGFSAVVLDTGIDLNHPYFGPDSDSNGVADRIVYQYDFANGDADASDLNGHGSNVTSIVASQHATNRGMAPSANIIALKVFTDAGGGNFGYIESALQWVIANAVTYNIASVNMSLGDSSNFNSPQQLYGVSDELATLAAMNVLVVSANGNDYFTFNGSQGVSYPAADPFSLAVGAVWDGNNGGPFNWSSGAIDTTTGADRLTAFSQRSTTMTDIFAPGAMITGANATGGTASYAGTSQATPHIAGIAVLADQLAVQVIGRRLTLTEFRDLIRNSAVTIFDGDDENDNVINTQANYLRVDMLALGNAIWALGNSGNLPGTHTVTLTGAQIVNDIDFGNHNTAPVNNPPVLAVIGNQSGSEGSLITFTASASDPDAGQSLTYSLGPGAPSGAQIHPTTGVFAWTPTDQVGTPFSVTIVVTDDGSPAASDSETIQIAVANVAPTLSATGPSSGFRGENRAFNLSASDASTVDQASNFTYAIDWDGDGSVDESILGPGGGVVATHAFAVSGAYSIKITVADKDGGKSGTTTLPVTISDYVLRPQAANPALVDLIYGGTPGFDGVFFFIGTGASAVTMFRQFENNAFVNHVVNLTGVTGRVIAHGYDSADGLIAEFVIAQRVELYGGNGDDVLVGGFQNDLLDGGVGNDILLGGTQAVDGGDTLTAGTGLDLLWGHLGADSLVGQAGEDLLVADQINFGASLPTAVFAIQSEWLSGRTYAERVANLSGTGVGPRNNGDFFLQPGATVLDDGAVDTLLGGSELDWLIYRLTQDIFSDEEPGETKTGT